MAGDMHPERVTDTATDLDARIKALRADITHDAVDGKVTVAQAARAGEYHLMRAVNELVRGVPVPASGPHLTAEDSDDQREFEIRKAALLAAASLHAGQDFMAFDVQSDVLSDAEYFEKYLRGER